MFGSLGFGVSLEHAWYRRALTLDHGIANRQTRIDGKPTFSIERLSYFIVALIRWLPTNRGRLLWVEHYEDYYPYPSLHDSFMAIRAGLGEKRSLDDAPGHYFDPHDYEQEDQTEILPAHAADVDMMIGLISLVMVGGWDAWLIADSCADRIEFWEGNIFFYSEDRSSIARAESLLQDFNCSRELA
jgi:hypothetical protein